MRQQHWSARVVGRCCLVYLGCAVLSAQELQPAEILKKLDENRIAFYRGVPDFFCQEHVISQLRLGPNMPLSWSTTDSIFRIKRRLNDKEHVVELDEARIVKTVDGKPVPSDDSMGVRGPAIVSGVFGGGLDLVTTYNRACYNYTFHTHAKHGKVNRIVVEYQQKPPEEIQVDFCAAPEQSRGRVTLDGQTMQVLKVEKHYPHHNLIDGVIGSWDFRAEYEPVRLGEKTLWLPLKISSQSDAAPVLVHPELSSHPQLVDASHPAHWSFTAAYYGCRRTGATARIMGPNEAVPDEASPPVIPPPTYPRP